MFKIRHSTILQLQKKSFLFSCISSQSGHVLCIHTTPISPPLISHPSPPTRPFQNSPRLGPGRAPACALHNPGRLTAPKTDETDVWSTGILNNSAQRCLGHTLHTRTGLSKGPDALTGSRWPLPDSPRAVCHRVVPDASVWPPMEPSAVPVGTEQTRQQGSLSTASKQPPVPLGLPRPLGPAQSVRLTLLCTWPQAAPGRPGPPTGIHSSTGSAQIEVNQDWETPIRIPRGLVTFEHQNELWGVSRRYTGCPTLPKAFQFKNNNNQKNSNDDD